MWPWFELFFIFAYYFGYMIKTKRLIYNKNFPILLFFWCKQKRFIACSIEYPQKKRIEASIPYLYHSWIGNPLEIGVSIYENHLITYSVFSSKPCLITGGSARETIFTTATSASHRRQSWLPMAHGHHPTGPRSSRRSGGDPQSRWKLLPGKAMYVFFGKSTERIQNECLIFIFAVQHHIIS